MKSCQSLTNRAVLTSAANALATYGVPFGGLEGAPDQQRVVPSRALQWISFAGVHVGFCERPREGQGKPKIRSPEASLNCLVNVKLPRLLTSPTAWTYSAKNVDLASLGMGAGPVELTPCSTGSRALFIQYVVRTPTDSSAHDVRVDRAQETPQLNLKPTSQISK